MNMKKTLNAFFKVIAQEAENNPVFSARLEAALGLEDKKNSESSGAKTQGKGESQVKRASNRRPPALLDPVQLARRGETELREELTKLNIEQLRDVVAEYGMDTGKLVLKWRDPERIIERVVEVARSRAQKGSAFRDQTHSESSAGHPDRPQSPSDELQIASDQPDVRPGESLVNAPSSEPVEIERQDSNEKKRDQ